MNEISQFLTWYGGLAVFMAVLAEQNGIPIPAAPLLLAAGALAAYGHLSLTSAVAATTAACVLADALWFYAGHRGKARLTPLFERSRGLLRERPRTTGVRAHLHGLKVLAAAKFLPLGTLVPLRAGTLDISPLRFFLLDAASSMIYASVYLLLGFVFHRQLQQVTTIIRGLGLAGLLLVVLLAAMYVISELARRNRAEQNSGNKSEAKVPGSSRRTKIQGSMKKLMSRMRVEHKS